MIKRLKELSQKAQIGDFGCGEAKIIEAIGNLLRSAAKKQQDKDKKTLKHVKLVHCPPLHA
jgi:hypothetical protein